MAVRPFYFSLRNDYGLRRSNDVYELYDYVNT